MTQSTQNPPLVVENTGLPFPVLLGAERAKRERLLITIAGVSSIIAIASVVALTALLPLKQIVPVVMSLDKGTGHIEYLHNFNNEALGTALTNVERAQLGRLVVDMEGYYYTSLSATVPRVGSQLSENLRTIYWKNFESEAGIQKKYGPTRVYEVRVVSLSLEPTGVTRIARVRWERTIYDDKGVVVEDAKRYESVVTYRFEDSLTIRTARSIEDNPLGIVVTGYSRTQETDTGKKL